MIHKKMKPDISPRVLNEARRQAMLTAMRMQTYWQRGLLRSWADLEKHFSIPIGNKAIPFNYTTFSTFREAWKNGVETRLAASLEKRPEEETKIRIDKDVSTFGQVTLYPEQEGCFKALREALFYKRSIKAAYQDGTMGSGKSFIGAALCAELINRMKILENPMIGLRPHPIMIFTPKGVAEHWKRILERAGLGEYVAKRKIYVFSNGEFTTSIGDMFCHEEEDDITGESKLVWNPVLSPFFCILDEGHNYIRPNSIRTRKIIQLFHTRPRPIVLFMSATPMEKVNDSRTFVLAIEDFEYMGQRITEDTFGYFAGLMDREPHKPNREAVKRLRKVLSPYIFSIPYIKPKFKAINLVWPVEFLNDNHRKIYDSAHARYKEACRKAGKNTMWGSFEIFIELNNYRKTVEPLRAGHLAERAARNYHSGKLATAVGCAFKETVSQVIFELVDKYNVPRDHISLVWGGKRQYRTEDLLTREEIDQILRSGGLEALIKDRPLLKRVRITLRYLQDQHEHDESAETQAYRHERLKALGLLGKQGDNARQIEIDKFQDGSSKICIFTLASGGVGLSFDRDKEHLLPREGLFTPVYNGKEFQQVLGRLVRRASLSDAYQYICMMKDTVETFHVAPILDEKLKCIAEITNRNFDIIDLLNQDAPAQPTALRDEKQAAADAENDDTIVTDFAEKESDEDSEDEDIETVEDLLKV